jgi:DNA-binding NarL/FixJ family response regulator
VNFEQTSIRILVVDDHPVVRQGIAVLIGTQADMTLVAEASNGREAIQQFREHRPDVTIMDLQMPEMNGLDALAAIRGEFPDARIIVLTTYTGDVQILRARSAPSTLERKPFPLKLPTKLLSTPPTMPSRRPKSAC